MNSRQVEKVLSCLKETDSRAQMAKCSPETQQTAQRCMHSQTCYFHSAVCCWEIMLFDCLQLNLLF